MGPRNAYTISIDGLEPELLNSTNPTAQLIQQMLWSKTDLTPGGHIFTLRNADFNDINKTYMALDFFRSVTDEATE